MNFTVSARRKAVAGLSGAFPTPRGAARYGCGLRMKFYVNGDIVSALADEPSDSSAGHMENGTRENFLARIHVQDRPGFLKAISNALHGSVPVSTILRLLDRDGVRRVQVLFSQTHESGTVDALLQSVEESISSRLRELAIQRGGKLAVLNRAAPWGQGIQPHDEMMGADIPALSL